MSRMTTSDLKMFYGSMDLPMRMKAMLFYLRDSLRIILNSNMDEKKKLEKIDEVRRKVESWVQFNL